MMVGLFVVHEYFYAFNKCARYKHTRCYMCVNLNHSNVCNICGCAAGWLGNCFGLVACDLLILLYAYIYDVYKVMCGDNRASNRILHCNVGGWCGEC